MIRKAIYYIYFIQGGDFVCLLVDSYAVGYVLCKVLQVRPTGLITGIKTTVLITFDLDYFDDLPLF